MDTLDEKNHVFNIRLAKIMGLYQILDPGTIKCRGKNIYHIAVASIVLYSCAVLMMLNVSGLYYWTVNMPISVDYFWKAEIMVFICYKMWIVVHRSDDIWNCLSVTRYGLTSSGHRNNGHNNIIILDCWRERSVWLTTVLAVAYLSALAVFIGSTLACSGELITIKNHDGTSSQYHQNVLNFYLIVSDDTYNAHYITFYIVETFSVVLLTILFLIFDVLLVTLCLAMYGQMQMICVAFQSVGHEPLHDHPSPSDYTDEKKKIPNKHDLIYDELITIIKDHQAVMEKYKDILAIISRVMLLQVFVSLFMLIMPWFILIMSFSDVDRCSDSKVVIKNIIGSIPTFTFQILMLCYLFENLHNQK
ncbi:uncharacterized protein LOC132950473 isoform X2 [Metopolophium dirhodum]|nr:uncharacterized protein LOC132950473 isoform X2 [Metopolophium dirhodum]